MIYFAHITNQDFFFNPKIEHIKYANRLCNRLDCRDINVKMRNKKRHYPLINYNDMSYLRDKGTTIVLRISDDSYRALINDEHPDMKAFIRGLKLRKIEKL